MRTHERKKIKFVKNILKEISKYADNSFFIDEYNLNYNRYLETLKICINHIPLKSSILDVGCSPGFLTFSLVKLGYSISALDLDPKTCIKELTDLIQIRYCNLDEEPIPYKDCSFDFVIFTEVLEHLHPFKIRDVLMELNRCLKPKGLLLLSTPNLAALENRIMLLFGGFKSFGGGITPKHHTREYTIREVDSFLNASNFIVKKRAYLTVRDLVTVKEKWKNIGRIMSFPFKALIPSLRSTIFIIAEK